MLVYNDMNPKSFLNVAPSHLSRFLSISLQFKSSSSKSVCVVGLMAIMSDDPEHPNVFLLTDSEHGETTCKSINHPQPGVFSQTTLISSDGLYVPSLKRQHTP